MIYIVNIDDIEEALAFLNGEAPVKSIQDRILKLHCNDEIPENYLHEKSFRQTIQRKIEDYCPEAVGFSLKGKDAKFNRVSYGVYRLISNNNTYGSSIVKEIETDSEAYKEGTKRLVNSTIYERDQKARAACIKHYGLNCSVCCINFEKTYGEIGRGFIHVHHLRPLSTIRGEYHLDPVKDLRPVCPGL